MNGSIEPPWTWTGIKIVPVPVTVTGTGSINAEYIFLGNNRDLVLEVRENVTENRGQGGLWGCCMPLIAKLASSSIRAQWNRTP